MKLHLKERVLPAAVVVTTVVVIMLAVLQYRWSTEVSEATGVRLADTLQLSMINWHLDFLRNFAEVSLTMRVDPEQGAIGDLSQYARRVAEWKAVARYPDLVAHVYLMTAGESARLQARRLNASSREFEPVEWPERLLPWTDALRQAGVGGCGGSGVRAPSWATPFGGGASNPSRRPCSTRAGTGLDRRRAERRGDSKQDSAGPGASLLPGDGRTGLSGRRGRRHIAARGAVHLRLRLRAGTGHRRGWDPQRLRAAIERGVAITAEGVSQDLGQSGTGAL